MDGDIPKENAAVIEHLKDLVVKDGEKAVFTAKVAPAKDSGLTTGLKTITLN